MIFGLFLVYVKPIFLEVGGGGGTGPGVFACPFLFISQERLKALILFTSG